MIMKECRVDGSYLLCPVDESKSLYKKIRQGVAEVVAEGYKQKALIQTMDSGYEKKSIYRRDTHRKEDLSHVFAT